MCMDYYVLCNNYVVFMCIFLTLLCLLATTRNPCVALQRQLTEHWKLRSCLGTFHKSLAVMTVTCLCASSIFFISKCNSQALGIYDDTSIYLAPHESILHSGVYKTWPLYMRT